MKERLLVKNGNEVIVSTVDDNIDIRQYVNTKQYSGPTKKGVRFSRVHINDFLSILSLVSAIESNTEKLLIEINDRQDEPIKIRLVNDSYTKGKTIIDIRRYCTKSQYVGWSYKGIRLEFNSYKQLTDILQQSVGEEELSKDHSSEYKEDLSMDYYEQLCKEFDSWAQCKEGLEHVNRKFLVQTPRFFILLCNLAHCDGLSENSKAKIAVAISYFMLPFDLIPEALIGPTGYIDDLVLSALVLKYIKDKGEELFIDKYWEYSDVDLYGIIDEIILKAEDLVGNDIYQKLKSKIL